MSLHFLQFFYKKNKPKTIEPFSKSKVYKFPYFRNIVDIYPVFQEELISLKQSFPQIENLKLFVGGSEIELMKNLYQLNLFSNKYCYENSDSKISINTIIKNIVPKMKTPEIVEDYIKKKTIKYAVFTSSVYLLKDRPTDSIVLILLSF